MATTLLTLTEDEFVEELDISLHLSKENISRTLVDLSLNIQTRLKAIEAFQRERGFEDLMDVVNRLVHMYEMSNTSVLRIYLQEIALNTSVDPLIKITAAKGLYNHGDTVGFEALNKVYPELPPITPLKLDYLKMLMEDSKYTENCFTYLYEILDNTSLDGSYRLRIINGLQPSYKIPSLYRYLNNDKNNLRFRLLAAQHLLVEGEIAVEKQLLDIAKNEDIEYNTRADATDMLLKYGKDTKEEAGFIIMKLGLNDKAIASIYDNAQNVHSTSVEKSVETIINGLSLLELKKVNGKYVEYEHVKNDILSRIKPEQSERVIVSLNRISLDRALYSSFNFSLEHLLLKIWSYITGHEHETELMKRLTEELIEMADTCSSGFCARIVNTLSGYDNFNLTITWEEQIFSNLKGRLNARIRDMDNMDQQALILAEMTIIENGYNGEVMNFLLFFRENISAIRLEMYEEFKSYMKDEDYDLYFKKAILAYESGGM